MLTPISVALNSLNAAATNYYKAEDELHDFMNNNPKSPCSDKSLFDTCNRYAKELQDMQNYYDAVLKMHLNEWMNLNNVKPTIIQTDIGIINEYLQKSIGNFHRAEMIFKLYPRDIYNNGYDQLFAGISRTANILKGSENNYVSTLKLNQEQLKSQLLIETFQVDGPSDREDPDKPFKAERDSDLDWVSPSTIRDSNSDVLSSPSTSKDSDGMQASSFKSDLDWNII